VSRIEQSVRRTAGVSKATTLRELIEATHAEVRIEKVRSISPQLVVNPHPQINESAPQSRRTGLHKPTIRG